MFYEDEPELRFPPKEKDAKAIIPGVGTDAEVRTFKNGGMESIPAGRFDLLPWVALSKIAALLLKKSGQRELGMKNKYPKNNWRLVPRRSHINHALGHIAADIVGDEQDDHLTHAATRLLFALESKDDRPYTEPELAELSENFPG